MKAIENPDKSWSEMADEECQPEEIKTSQHSKDDVNLQDVIVASAGDDQDVWVWKPLQVGYIRLYNQNVYYFCKESQYLNI